jgi:hypothetical protein
MKERISIFWFGRDLRLEDNTGLNAALDSSLPVLPIFIFDDEILKELPKDDARVTFIYESLFKMDQELKKWGSSIMTRRGAPLTIWEALLKEYEVAAVYTNHDYEPYAISRDNSIENLLFLLGKAEIKIVIVIQGPMKSRCRGLLTENVCHLQAPRDHHAGFQAGNACQAPFRRKWKNVIALQNLTARSWCLLTLE